eukprot:CAMPEP_0183307290 /NCGR_PEP_ID=MMETSP0160_2-20130417/17243_1 /TAXON_ID=2839 ORGANISM="Odontella Sinensis, Strain Grunow 1884" /NCGR_SAMPLE_ID=MMETSP0160_2 /ASSEMBLY_ACC=CAM_ASM_000250 /LENGTH=223 /DNA_ID=CAMNT_0025470845 /DNA_START=32 /DNA_END=703 /DNA_ORIENTATION=+
MTVFAGRRTANLARSAAFFIAFALTVLSNTDCCVEGLVPSLAGRQAGGWTLQPPNQRARWPPRGPGRLAMADGDGDGDGTEEETTAPPPPSKFDNILRDIHSQALPFRIVVIGGGAILETTSVLGPHMATSKSPKTGERLVTMASEDRSFEFHLKIDRVGKVTFTETDRPIEGGGKKTMRICRFLDGEGGPICSLILADASQEAADWFRGLTIRYGYEVQADE